MSFFQDVALSFPIRSRSLVSSAAVIPVRSPVLRLPCGPQFRHNSLRETSIGMISPMRSNPALSFPELIVGLAPYPVYGSGCERCEIVDLFSLASQRARRLATNIPLRPTPELGECVIGRNRTARGYKRPPAQQYWERRTTAGYLGMTSRPRGEGRDRAHTGSLARWLLRVFP
jgi:hypothetical protein